VSLLRVEGLIVEFHDGRTGTLRALDGIGLQMDPCESVGLVGESGSGKSVFALTLLGLLPSGARVPSGRVVWDGVDLLGGPALLMRRIRGREMAMIFQDPQAALNPVYAVGEQLCWILRLHRGLRGAAARREAVDLLAAVKLGDPERVFAKFPQELSGGMCQRVMVAMALACRPRLLVADEPTSALDVTTQAEILELIKAVQVEHGMALLFISHDLRAVARMCDRTLVLYKGRVVEEGPTSELMTSPRHPYTRRLVNAAELRVDEQVTE